MRLGPWEIIAILAVVLLIFGPKNLPKLGKSLGQTVKNIREGMEGEDAAEEELSEEDKEIKELEAKLAEAKAKKAEAAPVDDEDADK